MTTVVVCDQGKLTDPVVELDHGRVAVLLKKCKVKVPGKNEEIPSAIFAHYGDYGNDRPGTRAQLELNCARAGIQLFWVSTQPKTCSDARRPVVQRELPSGASYLHLNWSAAIGKWLQLGGTKFDGKNEFPVEILAQRLNIGAALLPIHTLLKGLLLTAKSGRPRFQIKLKVVSELFNQMEKGGGYRVFAPDWDWALDELNPSPERRKRLSAILNSDASLAAARAVLLNSLPGQEDSQGILRLLWEGGQRPLSFKQQQVRSLCELALAEIEFVMEMEASQRNLKKYL